jgi:hypothetical protein
MMEEKTCYRCEGNKDCSVFSENTKEHCPFHEGYTCETQVSCKLFGVLLTKTYPGYRYCGTRPAPPSRKRIQGN